MKKLRAMKGLVAAMMYARTLLFYSTQSVSQSVSSSKRGKGLTREDEEELGSEDEDEESDEKKLGFVVGADRFERHSPHEALEVDGFVEHAAQFFAQTSLHRVFYHGQGCLARLAAGLAA